MKKTIGFVALVVLLFSVGCSKLVVTSVDDLREAMKVEKAAEKTSPEKPAPKKAAAKK